MADANADTSTPMSSQITAPMRVAIGYVASNVATYLAAKGLITTDQVGPFAAWLLEAAPFIIGVAHMAYAAYANRKSAKVAQVQAMPDMQVVTTSQATKDAVPEVTKVSATADTVTVPVPKPTA